MSDERDDTGRGKVFNIGDYERKPKHQQREGAKIRLNRVRRLQQENVQLSRDYVIKGLIPKDDDTLVYGATSVGKTFFVLDMALSIATGMERYNGLRIRPGGVLYVASEAPSIVERRAWAWAQRHGLAGDALRNFLLYPEPIDLSDTEADPIEPGGLALVNDLQDFILFAPDELECDPIQLVIIDTWAQSLSADGNDNAAVSHALRVLKRAREVQPFGAVIVHHTGHTGDHARGASSLPNSCESVLFVSKNEDTEYIQVEQRKHRDGRVDGGGWCYELEDEHLGQDDDGDDVYVGVAVHVPDEIPAAGKSKGDKLSPLARELLEIIWGIPTGQWVEAERVPEAIQGGWAGHLVLPREVLREVYAERYPKAESAKSQLSKHLRALKAKGEVAAIIGKQSTKQYLVMPKKN